MQNEKNEKIKKNYDNQRYCGCYHITFVVCDLCNDTRRRR